MKMSLRGYVKHAFKRSLRNAKQPCNTAGLLVLILIFSLNSGSVSAQGVDRITAKAVYRPGVSLIQEIRETCDKSQKDFYACYIESLQEAGATGEALEFIKMLGEPGFMRNFRGVGSVDIAFVDFPSRANENQGCFLINGNPRLINVDDLAAITPEMLMKNLEYVKLKEKYPDINLWMGNRNGTGFIKAVPLQKGGMRFSLPYRLSEGCRACKDVGSARVGFYFDARGTFTGMKILTVYAVRAKGGN